MKSIRLWILTKFPSKCIFFQPSFHASRATRYLSCNYFWTCNNVWTTCMTLLFQSLMQAPPLIYSLVTIPMHHQTDGHSKDPKMGHQIISFHFCPHGLLCLSSGVPRGTVRTGYKPWGVQCRTKRSLNGENF